MIKPVRWLKNKTVQREWIKFPSALLLGMLIFFSFSSSAAASDSAQVILYNLTGKTELDNDTIHADLVFSLKDKNGSLIPDVNDLDTRIEINGEIIEGLSLTNTQQKNIHYIIVFRNHSEEVLRQVLTFVEAQNETDSFSLVDGNVETGYSGAGLSKKAIGQFLLDYFYTGKTGQCLSDQIIQAMMLARQSQEELQAILVISDDKTDQEKTCTFDLAAELFQISQQPFFSIPIYYLPTNYLEPDSHLIPFIQTSGGEIFPTWKVSIMEALNEAAVDMHSKLLVQFDTEIVKSINVLKLVISGDEISSGLDLYFTWDNLGKKYAVTLEESSKDLGISSLEENSVKIPGTLFNFLKYFTAALLPVSLIGVFCLLVFLRSERNENSIKRGGRDALDLEWGKPIGKGSGEMASLRILQSEAEHLIGRLVILNQIKTSIGRGRKNDIVLAQDKNLLENQVLLTQKGNYIYLEESSKAGFKSNMDLPTFANFLNSSRLGGAPVLLNDGDIIRLGPTVVLEFKYNLDRRFVSPKK